jgi:hypothetical protein
MGLFQLKLSGFMSKSRPCKKEVATRKLRHKAVPGGEEEMGESLSLDAAVLDPPVGVRYDLCR